MEDVNISKYRAQVVRAGSTPASPGFVVSEGQNPVDPSGSGQNHLPVTIATAATGLSITESQVLGGAGTVGQYIRGDGSLADFPATTGGGSSVSYYLNGSVSQGTIGGVAYREVNRTPIFGAGTDISTSSNGYIANFITDAGDPNKLLIPAGNWNLETYFSANNGGGSPTFYVELYKYNGTTFTLIATSSGTPELIAFGTNINPYFTTLAVPETVLALTDRLALRYYVNTSGRTITLHTENGHLCQVITTFTTGLTALNGLTNQVQFFAVGTSGTDFAISSASDTHTFNLPTASGTNRGALSSSDWTTFNNKENAITAGTTAQYYRGDKTFQTLNTSVVPELTNLYYTEARVNANANVAANTAARHNAVTLGTANGLSLSTQQLSLQLASGSQNGALSSTDWTTFNSKENAITAGTTAQYFRGDKTFQTLNTAAVPELTNLYYTEARVNANANVAANTAARHNAVTLGTANGLSLSTQQLSLGLASAGVTGALSGTDWSTFNNKQNALNGTGFVKISGTTISYDNSTYLTTAAAASTYLALAGGTMTGNINWTANDVGLTWSRNTDGAAIKFISVGDGTGESYLQIGTSDNGNEAIVFTQTSLIRVQIDTDGLLKNGSSQRYVFENGGTWGIAVTNGVVTTGSYANPSWITSLDWSKIISRPTTLAGYGITDAVPSNRTITINGTTLDLSANRTYNVGTVTNVTASSPLFSSGGATPNITIQQASGSQSGFLSSTDWTTFNNKQNALTNPVTGTGTTNYLPKFTGATSIGNSLIFDDGTRTGVGTNSLSNTLFTIYDSSVNGDVLKIESTIAKADIWLKDSGTTNGAVRIRSESNSLRFIAGADIRATIFNDGNFLLTNGSGSNAGYKLDVNGTGRFSGNLRVDGTSNGYLTLNATSTGGNESGIFFQVGGGNKWENYTANNDTALNWYSYANSTIVFKLASTGAATFTSSAFNVATFNSTFGQMAISFANSGTTFSQIGSGISVCPTAAIDDLGFGTAGLNKNIVFATGTAFTERMRITSGGNVGIGTTSPGFKLDVNGKIYSSTEVQGGSAVMNLTGGYATFGSNSSVVGIRVGRDASLNDIIINPSGNVSIGTTTDAGYKLDVNGTGRFSGNLRVDGTSNGYLTLNATSTGGNESGIFFQVGGGNKWENYTANNDTALNWYSYANSTIVFKLASTGAATFSSSVTATSFISDGAGSEGVIRIERDTVGTNAIIGALNFTNNNGATIYGRVRGGRNSAGDGYVSLGTGVGDNLYALEGGNVGIGTNVPYSKLDVAGSLSINGRPILDNSSAELYIGGITGVSGRGTDVIALYTNNTERMRITSGGNVLIGSAGDNGGKLRVKNTTNAYAIAFEKTNSTLTLGGFFQNSGSSGEMILVDTNGSQNVLISSSANSYWNAPSARFSIGTTVNTTDLFRVNGTTFSNDIMTWNPQNDNRSGIAWRFGEASIASVTPNRRLRVNVGGIEYYIGAMEV